MLPIEDFDPNGEPWDEEIKQDDELIAGEELLEFMGNFEGVKSIEPDVIPSDPVEDLRVDHDALMEQMLEAVDMADPQQQQRLPTQEELQRVVPDLPVQRAPPPRVSEPERQQNVVGRAQERAQQRKARIQARAPQVGVDRQPQPLEQQAAPAPQQQQAPLPPQFVALQGEHNQIFAELGGVIRNDMLGRAPGEAPPAPAEMPKHVAEELAMPAADDTATITDAMQEWMREGKAWRAKVAELFRAEADSLREDTGRLEEIRRHMERTRG